MSEALQQSLASVLAREVAGFQSLESCRQLTAGASQETYCITYNNSAGEQRLALRRMQPTVDEQTGVGGISLDTEARLLQLADACKVPVPRVIYVLQPADQLGSGFLMEWLDGETLGQRINRAEELADIRPQLARQCGQILGQIHAINWRDAGLEKQLPLIEPATLVDETWAIYRDLKVPVPMIDYAWRWLKQNLPTDYRVCLVHGDFRNGNIMVNPLGINAALDWELAHIGDPVRDLGWLCVNSWRFGNSDKPVGGFGEIADLLAGYRDTSGIEMTAESLLFWQVFGSFWWATTTLMMANSWRSGETPSLERPVIGRRSSEAQMDCANLLMPGKFELPQAAAAISTGTQLPMPAELLDSVASFLKDTVAAQLDPHSGFLARVAANSLGIAQREFQYGPELALQEKARLERLLDQAGELNTLRWELVSRLRSDMALDAPELTAHLRQTVAGQLLIDQPRYSGLQQVAGSNRTST